MGPRERRCPPPPSPRANSRGPKPSPNKPSLSAPALAACAAPADAALLAATFKSAKADRISDLLETLASLGQARALPGGKFVAA